MLSKVMLATDLSVASDRVVSVDILSQIIYATDFSDNAERAFQYVEDFVKNGCRKVTLMHVQYVSVIRPYLEERLQELSHLAPSESRNASAKIGHIEASGRKTSPEA